MLGFIAFLPNLAPLDPTGILNAENVRHTGARRCPEFKISAYINILDSGFRRNDGIDVSVGYFSTLLGRQGQAKPKGGATGRIIGRADVAAVQGNHLAANG